MRKIIYLYSGEGTHSSASTYKLIRHSPRWSESERILRTRFDIDLTDLWHAGIGRHQSPYSPLLTVITQICLADLWRRWGYAPHAVLGHSIGELAAAFQAGFYSLEAIIALTHRIGGVAARLEGIMAHGWLSEDQIRNLQVHPCAFNFWDGARKHVTLSGYPGEMNLFLQNNPDFTPMKPPHPWHHPDYGRFSQDLADLPRSAKTGEGFFVSALSTRFETQLEDGHWRRWMVNPVDFIGAMQTIQERYGQHRLEIIEIGFHPVLDRCCGIFDNFAYASSMFRGEDEIKWSLHQRKKLDRRPFIESLRPATDAFSPQLDYDAPLAYQDLSSIKAAELSVHLQAHFPSLGPQDFYRFKTIRQLIEHFGTDEADPGLQSRRDGKPEVVIAAMSCRLPAFVETLPQFWSLLLSQADQVRAEPARGDFEAGFLDGTISRLDHAYFQISHAEARTMDPQQILALELTEMLWLDAGLDPQALEKNRIGVYIGAWNQEYRGDPQSVYFPTGTNPSIIASRISWQYDLRGPSWVVNTACSSSLAAVHYAAQDIRDGRVDYAIAGGVNMILGGGFTAAMRNAGFLSPSQRCRTFDDSADGYVRAEGGGLVLLARKDIVPGFYAELLASDINQNGRRAQVMTAPHPQAQEELIRQACLRAGIAPRDVAYVECHGTGTKIGDPIEVSALAKTIAKGRENSCHIGSLKSNLGHLESAAGIAGLIKSVLILNKGIIPPNLHFNQPNRYIDFDAFPLKVASGQVPIDHLGIIGVSSFGFGGTNAHVIVRGAEERARKAVREIESPFDRHRAAPLEIDLGLNAGSIPSQPRAAARVDGADVRAVILDYFIQLTGIETIDDQAPLFEQGLDSMSATELVHNLEQKYAIDLDPDILFEYPLIDQMAAAIEKEIS